MLLHCSPKHLGHGPPQSMPVSIGSCASLLQVAGKHLLAREHAPERQSASAMQLAPSAQECVIAQAVAPSTHAGTPDPSVAHVFPVRPQLSTAVHVESEPHSCNTVPEQRRSPVLEQRAGCEELPAAGLLRGESSHAARTTIKSIKRRTATGRGTRAAKKSSFRDDRDAGGGGFRSAPRPSGDFRRV